MGWLSYIERGTCSYRGMWTNPPASSVLQERLEVFIPPYCPNSDCRFHAPENQKEGVFRVHGKKKIKRFPYLVFRYRCRGCRATFASSYFTLSYRDKKNDMYERIDTMRCLGGSKRSIASVLNVTECTIRRKLKKLARWSILRMAQDAEEIKINEPIAFDGLENFSFSQYDPNNLNHAVGKESYYIFDFNLSAMNRKGRMSPYQTRKKKQLEDEHGRYPAKAIEEGARKIFERLLKKSSCSLHLHSDNHYAYRDAIKKMKDGKRIAHFITPAKVGRNYRNRLFPINHTDMLTRHHLADFKRETIAFAKTSVAMLESFAIFAGYKNYRRSRFKKPHVKDPLAHIESPAMKLGLTGKIESFREFFSSRISVHHVTLNEDWLELFRSQDRYSRQSIRAYRGI